MSTTPPVPPPPAPAPSFNQKMLTQIRAVLAGKAMDDVFMYKLNGRELTPLHVVGTAQAGGQL